MNSNVHSNIYNSQAIAIEIAIAIFTTAKIQKQPKCPLTDEWIKTEYNSVIKKNEIMLFAATWMHLEIIILSEVSQTEKDKYHMISLICGI